MPDASPFYALLRYEEASLALRTALRLEIADHWSNRVFVLEDFRESFQFTAQGARTFAHLLHTMGILEFASTESDALQVSPLALDCLSKDSPDTRRPYLSMGADDAADALILNLQGKFESGTPLYAAEGEESLMESHETEAVAREVAYGLSSRAKCFAPKLASFISSLILPENAVLADLGAGSPYLAIETLKTDTNIDHAILVDRAAGLKFAKEMLELSSREAGSEELAHKIAFEEQNIFAEVPSAAVYCASNTAHDWLPEQYSKIANNIRRQIADDGFVVIHEPLQISNWQSEPERFRALWMACYALTLYRLTAGQGTCYTESEHDAIMQQSGFARFGKPFETTDGCTALAYKPV